MELAPDVAEFLCHAKVARLATADLESMPHVVPVVYVIDHDRFLIPLDAKRKTVRADRLKRVRNIKSNPRACLLVDSYDDDWSKLRFVIIEGGARIVSFRKREALMAIREKLVRKYPQYEMVELYNLFIVITPRKVISWANSSSGKSG